MSDFGRRALKDEAFAKDYNEQMNMFKQRVLKEDEFASKYGELGDVYGRQWRAWKTSQGETIDQIADVLEMIKKKPDSRRLIVSAWNPEDVPSMALPPCHTMFQFYVAHGQLSCQLYQRSCDIFLGGPFNIAGYALLTHLMANECGLQVGEFVHTVGDAHIYQNHIEQVKTQLAREPKSLPELTLTKGKSLFEMELSDMTLTGYDPHPAIKAPVAV